MAKVKCGKVKGKRECYLVVEMLASDIQERALVSDISGKGREEEGLRRDTPKVKA
jgi:hypothetical protein